MFDWISSKVAITVAGFLILVSSVGMLLVLHAGYDNVAMRNVADSITHAVDELATVPGDTSVNFTFDRSLVGVALPRTIRGVPYTLEFHPNGVLLTRSGVNVFSRFSENPHLWNPGLTRQASSELIALADRTVDVWTLASGLDFRGVRRYVEGVGFLSFVYHPRTESMQEYLDSELVPAMDRGETNPGSSTISVPEQYRVGVYPRMVMLEGTTPETRGVIVRGFVRAGHLWEPTSDRFTKETLDAEDAGSPGPFQENTFTVEWRIIARTDQPCTSCESGYRTTPEGFVYP